MIATPITYYGGKQMIAKQIAALMPHCVDRNSCYVEPFAGGLAVLFAKGKWGSRGAEIVNDKDERLINFWRVLQDEEKSSKLIKRLEFTAFARKEHEKSKQILQKTWEDSDDITRAWAYFVAIRQSFSSGLMASWVVSFTKPKTWVNRTNPDYLNAVVKRLKGIIIECDDAIAVIKRHDRESTFFYCDPPYPNANQGHYGGYTTDDLQALVDTLSNIKGKFLLSNYNQDAVKFPSTWNRVEIKTRCSANLNSQEKARTENLWSNYDLHSESSFAGHNQEMVLI